MKEKSINIIELKGNYISLCNLKKLKFNTTRNELLLKCI